MGLLTFAALAGAGAGAVALVLNSSSATLVAAPLVLTAVGFTGAGIAASSYAASMMSTDAVANGVGVAAGSVVAVLQAAGNVDARIVGDDVDVNKKRNGAAGIPVVGQAAVGATGAAVGTTKAIPMKWKPQK